MTIKVVLADDSASVRSLVRALLSEHRQSIEVVGEAENGREAVVETERHRPDVLVMDLVMPELDGIESLRLLRERCPNTRVLIVSIHSTSQHVHGALAAGAAGYVSKETIGAELVEAVKAVHGGARYLSPRILTSISPDN